MSLVICFLPRIMIGVVPYFANVLLNKLINKKYISLMISSLLGSFTNTILVLLLIFITFSKEYSTLMGISMIDIIKITMTTNGIVEAILAMIISPPVVIALKKLKKN